MTQNAKVTSWGLRALAIAAVAGASGVVQAVRGVPRAMGGTPSGERAARVAASPHFRDGKFHNGPLGGPTEAAPMSDVAKGMLFGDEQRRPRGIVPIVRTGGEAREVAGEGLFATWYGHSSVLLEIDGTSLLIDPVWGERVSPSAHIGPKRLHPNPVELGELPRIDAVVISHDHYDHLDEPTITWLGRHTGCLFVVPLGVGAHLAAWGVSESRIVDLDWDEDTKVGDIQLRACPAQHFSGRGFGRDSTQWVSWVIAGPEHTVFYSGDGGYFEGFARVGADFGPFDLTLVQVGAYGAAWPTIHMTPEDGVRTHVDVGGAVLLPVHWGTFNLALHAWSEPIERVLAAAVEQGVTVATPRPGERFDVASPPTGTTWWRPIA